MQRKKIIIALAVLGCAAVLGAGSYGILSQTADTSSKSAVADGKDETENQGKEEETTDQTDAAAEDTASIDGTATDKAATDTTSAKSSSSSNKSSGSSGSSSKSSSSGNSNKTSSGSSNKTSSSSSSKPSSSGNSNTASSGGSGQSKPSQPAHTHSYSSSVTTQPTCANAGVRTYKCSCGASYTESIPATGNHSWKEQYKTETVPAKTHQENVWKNICNGCNAQFDDPDDAARHVVAVFGDACSSYRTEVVDTITIIDEPETTKDVYIGSKCSVCGAWQ